MWTRWFDGFYVISFFQTVYISELNSFLVLVELHIETLRFADFKYLQRVPVQAIYRKYVCSDHCGKKSFII